MGLFEYYSGNGAQKNGLFIFFSPFTPKVSCFIFLFKVTALEKAELFIFILRYLKEESTLAHKYL